MIRPETVQLLIELTPNQLSTILEFSGHEDHKFMEVFFQGITESGKFKYLTNYKEDGKIQQGAVYVWLDHLSQMLVADF